MDNHKVYFQPVRHNAIPNNRRRIEAQSTNSKPMDIIIISCFRLAREVQALVL
mgnify:CR=1 FL=1